MQAVIPEMFQRENSLDFQLVLLGGNRYKIDSSGAAKKQMRGRNHQYSFYYQYFMMVAAERFDPPTLCSQDRSVHASARCWT
jgi:hypothetical protein